MRRYGVLKATLIEGKRAVGKKHNGNREPHYQIHVMAEGVHYRIAVNVRSKEGPSEVLYGIQENFDHEITTNLPDLPLGFTPLESVPDRDALDYIRGNLFDHTMLMALPYEVPGWDNDLNDKFEMLMSRVQDAGEAMIYAFGDRWGPESRPDSEFGFEPGNGIHNIHMNQGSTIQHGHADGVYRDGGILIHFPTSNRWIAVFLAFQSQCWHTDDRTGHRVEGACIERPQPLREKRPIHREHKPVVIVGANVNPFGSDEGREKVTLLNVTEHQIDLQGWALANKAKQKYYLRGLIQPGEFRTITLKVDGDLLRNRGDIITLLNADGLKVDGVSYTAKQAKKGRTIKF